MIKAASFSELAASVGLSVRALAMHYGIPDRTAQQWAKGDHAPPAYVLAMLERLVKIDFPLDKKTE